MVASGENGLKLYNNLDQGIYVDNAGKVGIGNTSPGAKLDVTGTVQATYFNGDGSLLTNVDDGDWTVTPNYIFNTGTVGIGTASPNTAYKLDVAGTVNANYLKGDGSMLTNIDDDDWTIGAGGDIYRLSGNVGIGKVPGAGIMLDVNGKINATELNAEVMVFDELELETLTVTQKIWAGEIEVTNLTEWKDYVFEDDYSLLSLSDLEQFIKEHKHLPGIPSESEALEEGIDLGEMNALLLQKIEELTLYLIQQQKEINMLKKQN